MAIYKLQAKTLGRNKGNCVTRAAAYRAGERIFDVRTSTTHDFSSRDDVVYREILLPSECADKSEYDWARDRATLWNTAENTDRRNAKLGREIMVALPEEMTPERRTQLARQFARELCEKYRGAVDLAVHLPREGARYPHAHLLMTARQVTPAGLANRTVWELAGL
jgi:ATP-dependent exoDNAse (exonuclease V) alpha subunit